VGESQRNLWLQAGHLKYTDTKPLTLLTTHTCTVTKSTVTVATEHLLIILPLHTHVGCALGLAVELASVLTMDTVKLSWCQGLHKGRETEQSAASFTYFCLLDVLGSYFTNESQSILNCQGDRRI